MSQINVDAKIEAWKNKLLDLGKRNRLLNFRETKRSSLKMLSPQCFKLYSSFVLNEQPLMFPNITEISDTANEEEEDTSYPIKTNQSPKETQRTLKSLRDKAKTALEEQGVNILYLSFGFLKWTESQDSDYWFNSPILLVPVSLTIESISSPYVLSLHEDEIVVNPTLAYKLENDFGIILPKYNDGDELQVILSEVGRVTETNKWEVVDETGLSLLSFLKINMYKDLSRNREGIGSNAIVRAISGDTSLLNKIPDDISDFDFDRNLTPSEMFQVVDADSSQQEAILCAKKGVSFVLQGPPGTGKSQTITNIIAECLADGKKVLFVSEKMAALDVVHRRLTSAGLNDFSLILHSYKANKRAVLDQLGSTLDLAQKKATMNDEAFQKLDLLQADKERLNRYASEVFDIVQPLEKSIYQVNGILAHLESYEYVIFQIENIGKINANQFNRFINFLQQLTSTIGKMKDGYKINPWYGSTVEAVSHELRYDIAQKLGSLTPKVENTQQEIVSLFDNVSLSYPTSYQAILDIIPVIKAAEQAPTVPVSWILGSEIEPLFDEVTECELLKESFLENHKSLCEKFSVISTNDSAIELSSVDTLKSTKSIEYELKRLSKYVSDELPYSTINNDFTTAMTVLNDAQNAATQIHELVNLISTIYEDTVFHIDYNGIYTRYKTDYTSFFKIFNKNYKVDKKLVQGQFRQIVKRVSDKQVLELVSRLRKIEELREWFAQKQSEFQKLFGGLIKDENSDFFKVQNYLSAYAAIKDSISLLNNMLVSYNKSEQLEKEMIAHYQFLYKGINTEWENIRNSLNWAALFRKHVEQLKLNPSFVENVCSGKRPTSVYSEMVQKLKDIIDNLNSEFLWFVGLFENQAPIKSLEMPALQDRLVSCRDGLSLLEEWIDFRRAREDCKAEGLEDYVTKIEELHIEGSKIIPVFKKRFFQLWLDAILPNYPTVLNFRRRMHESAIGEFARLDKIQFEIAKARIRSKLINDLPSLQRFTNGVDEISILKRELSKQRRIMPIRKLFREIPNLLLTLKPCLMMSPLSVSLFLEAETYQFDTVIFDEASQVCTENAIGAIYRGKQVIIAGDSKQLPPTNFFSTSTSSDDDYDTDDEDEYGDIGAYESVLDEAGLLPERTLLWHYRSRHEHLIAFSNMKIYKNKLITFPANKDKVPDNGVEYVYVKDGYYDRGGKKGNVIEAKKVAEMVFEHFKKYPNRSLGIITFGEVQQMAIDTAIRDMRLRNQSYEHFFKEDSDEPFFIKNLENVQGDERDAIIFSIGYAKDAAGVFRMNFGPLSKSGGERRLNVAITRAKYNVKLVGSIIPTDINIDKISSDGPKLLRAYVDFAMNGAESLVRQTTIFDVTEHDSPFEEAVYNFLDRKGYKVATQVGCSGYRIDMAVKHPVLSGVYVLGVECDGAAYHSARTARERDRLRQEVLENMGWRIYRIWSTDWIKDFQTEGYSLITAINDAIANYGNDSNLEVKKDITKEESDADDFVSIDKKEVSTADKVNPYAFRSATRTDFDSLPLDRRGYLDIADCIMACVNNEFPLHYELLCQRLASLYGNEKATVKVRREVDYGISRLHGKIVRKGDFLYPLGWEKITVRVPNKRKICHISVDELAEAMDTILQTTIGNTRESLCVETTRVYSWQRMTQGIKTSMNVACDLLIEQGKAQEIDGKIVPKQA
ncbi:MAG: DUF4011 domain-containing protein [Synergistota bacterium]|nr:DUF4011 domain-containing protein [Synergistota bacterium]